MSKGNELYVRKSKSSEPTASDMEDQMWDDSSMTAAYDKAVNKANAEIAKQIAMETNSKVKETVKPNEKKGKAANKSLKQVQGPKVWRQGMPCRAVYLEDGQDYEADVYAILDESECVVKFLGYDNTEIVTIDSLTESRGDQPRMRQIEQATGDKFDDGFESLSNEEASIGAPNFDHHKDKKSPKKKSSKKSQKTKASDFVFIPHAQENLFMGGPPLPDFRLPYIAFPPPPPGAMTAGDDPEEEALSSMLISWYMSGFHTGLYQGLKRGKESRRQ